jgi:hypothetical protein
MILIILHIAEHPGIIARCPFVSICCHHSSLHSKPVREWC